MKNETSTQMKKNEFGERCKRHKKKEEKSKTKKRRV